MKPLREQLRFYGEPKEEKLENSKYTLRYQTVDDRKHPEEVKPQGASFTVLVEVFDGDELTYQQQYGVHNNNEHREILEMTRREIERGEHPAKKPKH